MVKFESSSTKVCGTSDVLHATTVLESGPTVQAMHRRSRLTLAACCGVHGVQDGLGATLYVLLPVLAQALGLSYAQVGVIRAANNAAMGMLEIPSGMLSERFGQRSLLVFGLLCAGFGYSALAGASTFTVVFICLFVTGLGAAFQHALSSSIISETFRTSGRRTALGVYNSSGDVGKLAFTGCFSLAVGMGVAWQGVSLGFGVIALVASGLLLVTLQRLGVGGRPGRRAKGPSPHRAGDWGIRDRKGFAALMVIVFLDIAVQGSFLTYLAFLMIEKQVPTSLAAFAVVLTLAGGIFGKFGCGLLAERVGVIRSLVAAECLTAAGIIAILLSPTLVAYALLPVLGMVLQGSSSITYATVVDLIHRERQSRGFATIYSVSSVASVVGPIGFGVIGDEFGLTAVMLAMAFVVLLPVPLSVLLRPALAAEPV